MAVEKTVRDIVSDLQQELRKATKKGASKRLRFQTARDYKVFLEEILSGLSSCNKNCPNDGESCEKTKGHGGLHIHHCSGGTTYWS